MSNQVDYSGYKSGYIIIGSIVLSSPRKYSCRCSKCGTSYEIAHSEIRAADLGKTALSCRWSYCRNGIKDAVEDDRAQHLRLKAYEAAQALAAYEREQRAKYGTTVSNGGQ